MGQRLVVTIKDKGEPKMKVYYHWSGYTMSAFKELKTLWDIIKPLKRAGKSTDEILLGIIHGLEGNIDEEHKKWLEENYPDYKQSCHGGIGFFNKKNDPFDDNLPNEELAYIQSLYPGETFSTDVDRNNGLVYMSKDGMEDVQKWSEGNAEINIDTETFSNDIHWPYHGKEDYVEGISYDRCNDETDDEAKKEYAQGYDEMPTYKGDGSELFEGKCDGIKVRFDTIFDLVGNGGCEFKDSKGTVWELTA